jgi:pSer/pThr/pTyr-binding forkhead associated (FHA) protein
MPPTPPGPYLTDPQKQEHILPPVTAVIGRAVECDMVIASTRVSREHARLRRDGRKWFLEDLGSTNGTFLNDERVIRPMELRDGDQIMAGGVIFIFHDPDTTTRENPVPDLKLDAAAGVVRVNRRVVTLSPKEYALLAYLYGRRGQVCSKDEIGRYIRLPDREPRPPPSDAHRNRSRQPAIAVHHPRAGI